MAPKAKVTVESAVEVLKKHIKYFILPEKPKWSSDIWQTLSNELENKWDRHTVRTNVNGNRRNILTIALKECGYYSDELKTKMDINDKIVKNYNNSKCKDNDPDYCNHDGYFKDPSKIKEFDVEIRRDIWSKIIQISFNDNKQQCINLNKGTWTDIIAYSFWVQYRLKCAFIFDQGKISVNGINYLTIKAHCKSKKCDNRLLGLIDDVPPEDGPVYIKIKCYDTRYVENHEDCRRPLRSERRKIISKELKGLGVHEYTKQAATKLLRPGETGCPFLHKPNTLQKAKNEFIDVEQAVKPVDLSDNIVNVNDEHLNKNRKKASGDNLNYNSSNIPDVQLENWKGKDTNNKLIGFDWMEHDSDESAAGLKTNYEVNNDVIDEFSENIMNVRCDSSQINVHEHLIEMKSVDFEIHNTNHNSLNCIFEELKDHNYCLKTSTGLDMAINEVDREPINSGVYFQDYPEVKTEEFIKIYIL